MSVRSFLAKLPERWPLSWLLDLRVLAWIKASNRYVLIAREENLLVLEDRWFPYRKEISLIGFMIGDFATERDRLKLTLKQAQNVAGKGGSESSIRTQNEIKSDIDRLNANIEKGMRFLDDLEQPLILNRHREDGPAQVRELILEFYMSLDGWTKLLEQRLEKQPDHIGIRIALESR